MCTSQSEHPSKIPRHLGIGELCWGKNDSGACLAVNMDQRDGMKRFNVTGTCFPDEHYMVDIGERLEIIAQMVVKQVLAADYEVFSISFEGLADSSYATEANLAFAIVEQFYMTSMKKNNSVSALGVKTIQVGDKEIIECVV